jgi:hypothetical protein
MSEYAMPRRDDEPPPTGASTTDAAQEQAGAVAGEVKAQTQQVASHAAQETRQVVDQARNELSDLLWRSRSELSQQATSQQQRLAGGLRSLSAEIDEMTGASQRQGIAGQTASQLSGRISEAADFLEQRDFQGVLDELTGFARRRPGAFLLGAALVGVVAGRVTRGLSGQPSTPEPAARTADDRDERTGLPAPGSPVAGLATDSTEYPAYRGLDEPVGGVAGTPTAFPAQPPAHPLQGESRDEEYSTPSQVTAPPPSGFASTPEHGGGLGR